MRFSLLFCLLLLLPACAGPRGSAPSQFPRGQQGQYQRPTYLQPVPSSQLPGNDLCRSRLYLGLIGQHEGGVIFASLPGRTRVVKPAELEMNPDDFLTDMQPGPPYLEVREYLAGQILYAPAIRAVQMGDELGPVDPERLTVELDQSGYIRDLSCR